MRDLNVLVEACREDLRAVGLEVGEISTLRWEKLRGQLYSISQYCDRPVFCLELADFLAENDIPESAVRAILCRGLAYTLPGCWDGPEQYIAALKKIEEAYGWGIFCYQNRFDLRHPKKKPVLTLHCPHCGLRWEVREKRKADLLLDEFANCPLCPTLLVQEGQEEAVVERNLPALAVECRQELLSIGIPLGEVSSIRFGKLGASTFGVCHAPPHKPAQIEIDTVYQSALCSEDALKVTLLHEFLHTCPGDDDHGPQWRGYARRVQEAYGYALLEFGSLDNTLHWDEPVLGRAYCTNCGGYEAIRDPEDLRKWKAAVQDGWKTRCDWCGTHYIPRLEETP